MPYTLLASFFIALALIGLVVPGLPTTPFVLLGAWAASRGSPRLHRWLHEHPRLGPPLTDWQQQRAIAPRAKLLALTLLAISWGTMYLRGIATSVLIFTGVLFVGLSIFVVTRPAPASRLERV